MFEMVTNFLCIPKKTSVKYMDIAGRPLKIDVKALVKDPDLSHLSFYACKYLLRLTSSQTLSRIKVFW